MIHLQVNYLLFIHLYILIKLIVIIIIIILSDAFISDTEYTFDSSNAVCSCCYEWGKYMYKCIRCHRKYHIECHIPIIIPRYVAIAIS